MLKNSTRNFSLSVLIAALIIAIDQWTKLLVAQGTWASSWIRPLLNEGISFSISLPAWATWILTLGILCWLAIDVIRRKGAKGDWVIFGIIFGGAVSNLIDRLRLGAVFDWIAVPFFSVFNIADIAIVVGLATYVILTWRHSHEARENTRNS